MDVIFACRVGFLKLKQYKIREFVGVMDVVKSMVDT